MILWGHISLSLELKHMMLTILISTQVSTRIAILGYSTAGRNNYSSLYLSF